MDVFRADLHIHSRFSRATSGRLGVRHLAAWGLVKGLNVIGTGDFTHPEWREELERDLVRDEASGLYRLREPLTRDELAAQSGATDFPRGERAEPLFLLQAEISSIYKREGSGPAKVRKVHNLIFLPDFASVDALNRRLSAVGNLKSDGRPILGLDSERLLEMLLETDERGVLIPAHVWTPWFALFGSKSGFDRLEDCFGSLSSHIFALETGLSSDPDMNRLWSALDRYVMVSNSDAHSGENLGREANLFSGSPSFDGLFNALRQAAGQRASRCSRLDAGNGTDETPADCSGECRAPGAGENAEAASSGECRSLGTMEFFPEEGKYHLDGHRACKVIADPLHTRYPGDLCPHCGKPLTVGVLHRVLDLADRKEPRYLPGEPRPQALIPLPEVLGEILGVGAKSRKVQQRQADLVARFGPELDILHRVPEADLRRHWDELGEAVSRMRRGEVFREGGYDGEYGVVRVFSPRERADLVSGNRHSGSLLPLPPEEKPEEKPKIRKKSPVQGDLSGLPPLTAPSAAAPIAPGSPTTAPVSAGSSTAPVAPASPVAPAPSGSSDSSIAPALPVAPPSPAKGASPADFTWSEDQARAIQAGPHPVLVLAGPGSGKTRTLVGRILSLLRGGKAAASIVAVTFTRRAAAEVRERLEAALPEKLPQVDTLHALALAHWTDGHLPDSYPADIAPEAIQTDAGRPARPTRPTLLTEDSSRAAFARANPDLSPRQQRELWKRLELAREELLLDKGHAPDDLAAANARYLAFKQEHGLADYTDLLEHWLRALRRPAALRPWTEVLVDEIQDLSPLQMALIQALLPPSGQGFFGIGDPDQAIYGFRGAQPDVAGHLAALWPDLEQTSLRESHRSAPGILQAASRALGNPAASLVPLRRQNATLHRFAAASATEEAAWIAEQISGLLGGTSHSLEDARRRQRSTQSRPDLPECSPGEVAILVRLKQLMPPLRAALEARGLPCAAPEAAPFWREEGVSQLLALAARALGRSPLALPDPPDPRDLASSGDLAGSGDLAAQLEAAEMPPDDLLALDPPSLLTRLESRFDPLFRDSTAFAALRRAWKEEGSWERLLDALSLRQDLDEVRAQSEQVQIMTLHAAKGLEFRAVFLPALEEGILPLDPSLPAASSSPDTAALEEERRLLYVGLTRAEDALFLSHAARRTLYGRPLTLPPSRFLPAIEALFQRDVIRHKRPAARQLSLLD